MSRLKELQEKRLALAGQIREIGNRSTENGLSAEDSAAWEQVNADYDATLAEMNRLRAGEEVKSRLAEMDQHDNQVVMPPLPGRSARLARENDELAGFNRRERSDLAFRGWCLAQCGKEVSPDQQAAMRQFGISERTKELALAGSNTDGFRNKQRFWQTYHQSVALDKYQAASMTTTGGSGADGGKSIAAETFLERLEVNMLAYGPMWQTSEVIVTDHGNTLVWPTVNDTAQTGAAVSENATMDASGAGGTNPTFAQVTWSAYKRTSEMILVTQELIEDSSANISGLVGDLAGERVARGTNAWFTTGTGSSQPTGIATSNTTTGVTCASTTAFTSNEVISLIHSVDPAYRGMGRTGFMVHDNQVLALRLLKDGQSQYMWQPGMQAGVPDRLYGYPVYVNQAMTATLATTVTAMVFGDLASYKVRQVRDVRFYQLNELYRATDKVGFIAAIRVDGKLFSSGTPRVKRMVMA